MSRRVPISPFVVLRFVAWVASPALVESPARSEQPMRRPEAASLPSLPPIGKPSGLTLGAPVLEALDLPALLGPNAFEIESDAATSEAASLTPEQYGTFVDYVRAFEAKHTDSPALTERLDYASAVLHVGRPGAAIQALMQLEEEFPGRCKTAARLAMAHEVAGNLEEAVLWLARSIERAPRARAGTEWLHAAILRAKLKLRSDPQWLRSHSVLAGLEERAPAEIVRAIEEQLRARSPLAKPPDPIVCDLYFQAALRVTGGDAGLRRRHYLRESQRFGDWRKAEIARLPRT